MITARLNDYRQSPRKVRLVASLIVGKTAVDAQNNLGLLVKRASKPLADLLDSAIANAKNNFSLDVEKLFVKEFRVDAGATLKRRMPRARGMAYPINKRTSHVLIVLDTVDNMPKRKGKVAKAEVKAIKAEKPAVKKAAKADKK